MPTTITVTLQMTGDVHSKAEVLIQVGAVASALKDLVGVEILDVSDDFAASDAVIKPSRKTRGPNKPKVAAVLEPFTATGLTHVEIPAALRRTAE
jgi:hypothetical protein